MVRKPNTRSKPAPPEPGRLARRSEERRLGILRAAGRVFRRRGYAETGMREIASEAELSPANLYHYFKGKHELLFFCQDRALDQMLAVLRKTGRTGEPVTGQLHAVIQAHTTCLLDEVEGASAHLEVESLPQTMRKAIVGKRDRYERALRALVVAGVRRGEIEPCDPRLVTRAMLGAINWTARWFRPDGPQPAEAVAQTLADYLVRGLAPQSGAVPAKGAKGRR